MVIRINLRIFLSSHIIATILKTKDRENIVKAASENILFIYLETSII